MTEEDEDLFVMVLIPFGLFLLLFVILPLVFGR